LVFKLSDNYLILDIKKKIKRRKKLKIKKEKKKRKKEDGMIILG